MLSKIASQNGSRSSRDEQEWDDLSSDDRGRRGRRGEYPPVPPPSPRATHERPETAAAQISPSAVLLGLRAQRIRELERVGAAEMKFFSTTANTGILSQYTWSNADQLGNIASGTGQNQRLGRQIRVHRMRIVLAFSDMAGNSRVGVSFSRRVDPTVAGSDLFPGNGSARSELEYPNPLLVKEVYQHEVNSTMAMTGSTYGTTPSYAAPVVVCDQSWKRGLLLSYDAGNAIVGPSPVLWFVVNETSISCNIGTQIWFTDE